MRSLSRYGSLMILGALTMLMASCIRPTEEPEGTASPPVIIVTNPPATDATGLAPGPTAVTAQPTLTDAAALENLMTGYGAQVVPGSLQVRHTNTTYSPDILTSFVFTNFSGSCAGVALSRRLANGTLEPYSGGFTCLQDTVDIPGYMGQWLLFTNGGVTLVAVSGQITAPDPGTVSLTLQSGQQQQSTNFIEGNFLEVLGTLDFAAGATVFDANGGLIGNFQVPIDPFG